MQHNTLTETYNMKPKCSFVTQMSFQESLLVLADAVVMCNYSCYFLFSLMQDTTKAAQQLNQGTWFWCWLALLSLKPKDLSWLLDLWLREIISMFGMHSSKESSRNSIDVW